MTAPGDGGPLGPPVDVHGMRLGLPTDWVTTTGTDSPLALVARERWPEGDPTFRTNLTLAVDAPGMDFRTWQEGSDVLLAGLLDRYRLLDLEHVTVLGGPGVRRLAHHVDGAGRALVMEQWAALVGTVGITLTGTVETLRYVDQAPLFAAVVASWQVAV